MGFMDFIKQVGSSFSEMQRNRGVELYKQKQFALSYHILLPFAKKGDINSIRYVAVILEKWSKGDTSRPGTISKEDCKKKAFDFYYQGAVLKDLFCIKGILKYELPSNDLIKFLTTGAELDDPYCMDRLGENYLNGRRIGMDLEKAVYYFKSAAEKGFAPAYRHLGMCYENGIIKERDEDRMYELAIECYKKCGKEADNDFERVVNKRFKASQKREKEEREQKARQDFEAKLKLADSGDQDAASEVGFIFMNGLQYVSKDLNQAIHYYTIAFEKGNPNGAYEIGNIYKMLATNFRASNLFVWPNLSIDRMKSV